MFSDHWKLGRTFFTPQQRTVFISSVECNEKRLGVNYSQGHGGWSSVFTGLVSSRNGKIPIESLVSILTTSSEIRIEMSLPESSIANLQYPDTFPSPPNEESAVEEDRGVDNSFGDVLSPSSSSSTAVQRRRRTGSIDGNQQQSWYYYLIEIALRRIGNRVLNAFYKNSSYPGYGIPVSEMMRIATDFETQLQQW